MTQIPVISVTVSVASVHAGQGQIREESAPKKFAPNQLMMVNEGGFYGFSAF